MKIRILVSLLAILTLAGCDQKTWIEKFIPKDDAEFAKNYIALFEAGDFDKIEATIDPKFRNAQLRPKLEQIAALLPAEKPHDIQTVGAQTFSDGDRTQVNLTFQYAYPGKWLLVNVVLQKKGSETFVAAVNVQPLPDSLDNINRFTFKGKGATHIAVFAIAIIVPLLIVVTIILCIRTPIPKRKWLWILFILLGFVQLTLNWSNGNVNVNPFSFQLLGAGFWRSSLYGPLFLSASIPIGAIAFLLRRKKWLVQANPGQQGRLS